MRVNVDVGWYVSTRRNQSSGSNLCWRMIVWPIASALAMKPPGPEWYSGPVVMYTSSSR